MSNPDCITDLQQLSQVLLPGDPGENRRKSLFFMMTPFSMFSLEESSEDYFWNKNPDASEVELKNFAQNQFSQKKSREKGKIIKYLHSRLRAGLITEDDVRIFLNALKNYVQNSNLDRVSYEEAMFIVNHTLKES